MNIKPHIEALRREACRLLPRGNDRTVVLDRIMQLEGWLEELARVDVQEARRIRRHTNRPGHYGGCRNQLDRGQCRKP